MSTSPDPNTHLAIVYYFIFATIIFVIFQRKRFYKLSTQFPGPLALPFVGIFHRLNKPSDLLPKLKLVIDIYKSDTIFTYFGPQPILYTIDPRLIELVFKTPHLNDKPQILYSPLSNLFGDGLFSSPSHKWSHHRKLINPAFRIPVLKKFVPIFNRNTIDFLGRLDKLSGIGGHNLNELLQRLTLTTAVETILGREKQKNYFIGKEIVQHYSNVMKSTIMMIILNVVKISSLARLFNFYKSRDAVFSFVQKLIDQRHLTTQNNNSSIFRDKNNSSVPLDDEDFCLKDNQHILIDQLLKNFKNNDFNWQDVMDEANSVIFGAFDTTATAMHFSLIFLAMHPEIQEKLFQEIEDMFPERELQVENHHLNNLPYLEMFINEVERLAPSVPTIGRAIERDTHLNDKITLPQGLVIVINIFQLHRNVNIWGEKANDFNPENFFPENIQDKHSYAYMPFSKGLRNCVGGRYAIMALKVFLIHTVRNYRFSTRFLYKDLEFLNHITLKLQKQPLLQIHRRDK